MNTPSDIAFRITDYSKELEKREKDVKKFEHDIFCSSYAKKTYGDIYNEITRFGEIVKEAGFDPKKSYKMSVVENTIAHKESLITEFDYSPEIESCWFNNESPDGSFHRLWGTKAYDNNEIRIVEEVKEKELKDGSITTLLSADEYCALPSGELKENTDFIKENYNVIKKVEQVTDAVCPDYEPELEHQDDLTI